MYGSCYEYTRCMGVVMRYTRCMGVIMSILDV